MAIALLTNRMTVQTKETVTFPSETTFRADRQVVNPVTPAKSLQPAVFQAIPFLDPALSLSDWVRSLHRCVEKERNIIIAPSVTNEHIARLTALQYPNDRRTGAEYWSIAGNWQFKVPKTMTMADYFPSNDQLKPFVDYFVSKSRMREIISKERRNFQQNSTATVHNAPGDAEKAIAEITNRYSYEQKRRLEAEETIVRIKKEKIMLENQVEKAKTVFSNRLSAIATHVLDGNLTAEHKLALIGELLGVLKPTSRPKNTENFHSMKELNDLPEVKLLKPPRIAKKS